MKNKRRKILFYLTWFPGVGGIENVTAMVLSKLAVEYDCTIVSHLQEPSAVELPENVVILKMPDSKCWTAKQNAAFLKQLLSTGNFNLVIYQDSYAPTDGMVLSACQETSIPVVVFEHNSPLFVENKLRISPWHASLRSCVRHIIQPLLRKREQQRKRRLLRQSARYVLLSERFVSELEMISGLKAKEYGVSVIHNPIVHRSLSLSNNKSKEILYVGRLVPEKRVDLIVKVWAQICEKLPDWKLTIVGDGPERNRVESMARNLPRISFDGFRSSAQYYQRASLFLMASKFEGWGMTIVEAMQYGCVPIVVNSFSSLADIIDNGKNGLLLPENETLNKWSEAIVELANDDSALKSMAANAIKKTEEFDLDKIIAQWRELIEDASEQRHG